ncbi:TetR/AcrR family transcriptional regulator [Gimesia maris]|uniref:HTH-type transcriptional regulator RutR n=1 Tax=Gimesia maris TaxID=122 RepID=A0ABX5YV33_9PLAN|nr:TetR/AcrR family transcriptional regulator [Gimesia maris]EDL61289.1 transcriptional regulator, TetR family protein [Gimesia maris DSM 8797]QDU17638.1 HTH-type transcriptional regulator RutR [Gimesia maris]QEG19664.1 HTH-type transcriptional regulator RutR [Gimesia maris]QGQ27504.1 TetR/AcrR family transcriptional regulator [Gimesia maris]
MNQTSGNKTRLTDRKRAAIMEAAVSEWKHQGYDNTSMDRIAEVASVSKRTVYNHFPSKEELFAAIVAELMSRCQIMKEFDFDPKKSISSQLTAIGKTAVELMTSTEFQDLARVTLSRFLQSPEIASEMLIETTQVEAELAVWFKTTHEAGQLRVPDPTLAAKQFLGLIQSFAFWPPLIGKEPPLTTPQKKAVVKSTVSMFLDHYKPSNL